MQAAIRQRYRRLTHPLLTRGLKTRALLYASVFALVLLIGTWPDTASSHELLDFVKQALIKSDAAFDIRDLYTLSELSVQTEEHQFDYQLIPLTNIGFAKNSGSQTLGLEVAQKLAFGTEITAGVRGDRTDLNTGYVVEDTNIARAYLRVSQGLFRRWGDKYNLASLNIAKLKSDEQKLKNERSRQDLILQTATGYYQLVLAKQLIAESEKALMRSREHLAASTSRQSVGLVSKVDVYRAEIAALNAENSVQDKQSSYRRAQDSFSELLGMDSYEALQVQEPIRMISPIVPENWEEALLNNRLDWQSYRIRRKYASLSRYKAQEETKPDILLNLGVEQKGQGESVGDATNLDETNWSIQLELRSSLDMFNEKNNLTRENINMRKLKREGESLKRTIMKEAREALENLKTQERYYRINVKRMEQAGNALDLTKIRYEQGLSDNLDLLDAEDAYSSAQFDISKALVAYNIAAKKLAHSMGVLDMEWIKLSLEDQKDSLALTKTRPHALSAVHQ